MSACLHPPLASGVIQAMPVDVLQAELMLKSADEVFDLATCLAVGPGLGQSDAALTCCAAPLPANCRCCSMPTR